MPAAVSGADPSAYSDTLDLLVGAVAHRHPDRPALRHHGRTWTYQALWARSAHWAAGLRAAGIGPGDLVGVCLRRTPDLVAALLGVHRAGAAYVPLDPEYPRERLEFLLSDSGAAVVLVERTTAHIPSSRHISAEDLRPGSAAASAARPDELAYVIYTSGSTGQPKGVAIEHRHAVALVRWAGAVYDDQEWSGVLFSTSICFDLSVFEVFATLANAGTVVIAENALELPVLPDARHVRLVNTVPSAMAVLTRQGDLPRTVRTVNLAGEPLPRPLADAVYAAGVHRLVNLYGPTEDTTYSTWAEVPRSATEAPTIGRPLPGTRAYLLAADGTTVADGEIGELHLAGAGVARGYLGRSDLTAERFSPDPQVPGARMYRTGDLAQLGADGELRYRGRTDHQVKIRGYRVELGEVEAVLARHSAVTAAVVVVRDGPAGDPALVAFVASPAASGDAAAEVAAQLMATARAALPAHMLPAAVRVVAELPLTPNGKIDRNALPAVQLGVVGERTGERAATALEAFVSTAWAEVLALPDELPVDATFAELGGNSLLAASVLHRLASTTGRRLSLSRFPPSATIRELAATFATEATVAVERPVTPGRNGTGSRYRPAACQSEFYVLDEVGGGAVSVIPFLVRASAVLDLEILRRALDLLPRRHEVLRTSIAPGDDGLVATITPARPVPMTVVGSSAELLAAASDPIDLAGGQLLEGVVRDPAADGDDIAPTGTTAMLLRVHHAAADGWSARLLIRDLGEVHAALAAGREPPPPPELQFADCADWLADARAGADERLRAFWAERLRGVHGEAAPAPTRSSVRRSQGRPGAVLMRALDRTLVERLTAFTRDHRVTVYATVLATTAIRVQRETGVTDMVFRVPVSNRRHPSFEDVVGPFLETSLARVDVSGDPSFAELVARLTRETAAEVEHGWADPDATYAHLRLTRDTEGRPVGQTLIAVQNYRRAEHTVDGVTWSAQFEPSNGGAKTDLGFFWELSRPSGPALDVEYDTELHTEEGVAGYVDHILRLLDGALAQPRLPISALAVAGPKDEAAVAAFNERAPLIAPTTAPEQVATQVARTPDAVAVRCPRRGDVTYRALHEQALRLADRIRRCVGPGGSEPIAVACRRGVDGIAAMLAAWHAGRPYLPLDTTHPVARLESILADSAAIALVGDESCPALSSPVIPRVDPNAEGGEVTPPSRVTATDPAYVIYTSGSTGRPKGVRISHGALAAFLEAMSEVAPLGAGDVVAQVTTPSFDIAGLEIWLPLCAGAAVGVVDEETVRDGFALSRRLDALAATVVQMTPSGWALLLESGALLPAHVRALIGGEPVPPGLAAALVARLAEVWNVYGPTEATIWSCVHRIRPTDTTGATVPIGRPLGNTTAFVLDDAGQVAPVGTPGWIHLAGSSLADGYHGLPELTAAAFRTGAALPGRPRIYRTGDRGVLRADGILECLGRTDNQVKVGGVRIELEEVETAIRAVPGVLRAAARVQPDGPAAGRLVGYVVGPGVDRGVLRDHLGEHLPAAMVPSLWVQLDQLPLNTAGKIDRRALPAPEPIVGAADGEQLGELELFVAEVWLAHLPTDRVPAGASFFELGGHSLAATRVIGQLRAELGLDLTVRLLFHNPTLRAFAAGVEELIAASGAAVLASG